MATAEGTGKKCLDDSLTNIQWLCELESSELLLAKKTARINEPMAAETSEPHSPNPYSRPPYSYATLILLAINSTEDKRMTLQEIYKWIEEHYPYYSKCKKAWKNSIRHNLSLHSFFLKEKRPVDLPGKGSYWSISPEGKENIMREVIKHAQPMMPSSFVTGQGLRPILPKPADPVEMTKPKICSIVNGGSMMPVVVLPTNVYMSLAAKIASGNLKGSIAPLGPTTDISTTSNTAGQCDVQGLNQVAASSDGSTNVNALMNEILKNASFSQVLDSIKEETKSDCETQVMPDKQCLIESQTLDEENKENTIKTPTRKHQINDKSLGYAEPKRIKSEKDKDCLFTKPCAQPRKSTPVRRLSRSPLQQRNQPTLAAINETDYNTTDKDFKFQELSELMLSPVCVPSKSNSISKLSTPTGASPFASLPSGLTPFKYDSDSGFFTPLKDSDFDYLLSPNQLDFQITPGNSCKSKSSTPQKCRKSLRLGKLMEEENENDAMPWMNI